MARLSMLEQLLRIGKHAFVSFPNFGHWRVRWYLGWVGRMPETARNTVRPSGDNVAAVIASGSRLGLPCSTLRSGCSSESSGEP